MTDDFFLIFIKKREKRRRNLPVFQTPLNIPILGIFSPPPGLLRYLFESHHFKYHRSNICSKEKKSYTVFKENPQDWMENTNHMAWHVPLILYTGVFGAFGVQNVFPSKNPLMYDKWTHILISGINFMEMRSFLFGWRIMGKIQILCT